MPKHKRLIKVGAIGLGNHAMENLLPVISLSKEAELFALSSRDQVKLNILSDQYRVLLKTTDWRFLFDSADLDAVVVSATPDIHAEVAEYSLNRGVSVFVEKPPASSKSALEHLVSVAQANSSASTGVGYNFRYGESLHRLLQITDIEDGRFRTKIRFISSKPREFIWHFDDIVSSVLYAVGIHAIELILFLSNSFRVQFAQCTFFSETVFSLDIIFENLVGGTALLELGNYSNKFEYDVALTDSSGRVCQLIQHNKIVAYNWLEKEHSQESKSIVDAKELTMFEWPSLRNGWSRTGYEGVIHEFIDSIKYGNICRTSFEYSLPVYESIEAILALLRK